MLRDEIKQYTQDDGLISPDKNPSKDSTGNGLLYLSLYHLLLSKLRESSAVDTQMVKGIIESCEIRNMPGCFKRSPTKEGDQTSKDDYYGIFLMCRLYSLRSIADRVYKAGSQSRFFPFRWVYDIESPGYFTKSAWFGRFPEWTATIKAANRMRLSIIDELKYFAHCVFVSLFSKDESTVWILGYICQEITKDIGGFFVSLGNEILLNKIKKLGGMQRILALHLKPEHPIAMHWVNK